MGSDAEQANILTGKQVEPGRGTVEGLCLIIEHRVEREIFRQGQVGIIPRFGERDRLPLDGHPQIVEVGIADQKGHAGQVSQGVWKGERYLPASGIHADHRFHGEVDYLASQHRHEMEAAIGQCEGGV